MLKRLAPAALLIVSLMMPTASALAATDQNAFNPGDLIKSSSNSAVYYFASNGKRYVFPNEKTYFTWYTDFSKVRTIPARSLSAVPIGGNVTYRPGRKMVKITTDPRVYVIDQGGVLRHVTTVQLAESLYALSWKNQIDDLPDAFFTNYRLGTAIESARDFTPQDVMTQTTTIAQDKQLSSEIATIAIGDADTNYVPATISLKKGTTITWNNVDVVDHTVTGTGWASGNISPGKSYSRTFNTVGSFDYRCNYHSLMQGTINILP